MRAQISGCKTTFSWYTKSMDLDLRPKIFGSALRTRILVATAALKETYSAQLARLLNASPFSTQRIVDALERERLVATRRRGKERLITLNPESAIAPELRALLLKIAQTDPEYRQLLGSLRRRPRRRGKPVTI